MSDAYRDLLDATIAHLEMLRGRGVAFVSVSPGTLAALGQGRRVAPCQSAADAARAGSAHRRGAASRQTSAAASAQAARGQAFTRAPAHAPLGRTARHTRRRSAA